MFLKNITLSDFRNNKNCRIDFADGINIIYGDNAAGKTNILEAIFLFAAGKSFRGCKEKEMICFEKKSAYIEIDFCDLRGENNLSIKLTHGENKQFFKNSARISKLSEYLGLFRAVIFTPDHLNLVKGAPEFRRKFIDLAICQSFPRYVASLNEYNRTLMQKNALLKQQIDDEQKLLLLSVYNERLAHYGAIISQNREKYISRLSQSVKDIYSEMTDGSETISLEYVTQADKNAYEKSYMELYREKAETELQRRLTLYGTHKDDLNIYINGKSARFFASQGQQRSAVLSLKLGEGELSKNLTGEYPVFLFDDILSELDAKRKAYIMKKIEDRQVIITGCEKEYFDSLDIKEKFYIKDGRI